MNLTHLKYAVEVEKTGSITQAAKNLYMGQPNLSKAIKELESELNITIFKRGAKGVEPTDKGSEFLSYAKTIISQMDELESLYKTPTDEMMSFKISVPRATYVSVAFADFVNSMADGRELNIHFKESSSKEAIDDVASGECDAGIVRYQQTYENYFLNVIESSGLNYEPLWEFLPLVMMNKNHPLANYQTVPFSLLNNYTEIVHGDYQIPSLSFSKIRKDIKPASEHKRIFVYDRGSQYDLLREVNGSFMWVSPIPQSVLDRCNFVTRKCDLSGITNKDIVIFKKNVDIKDGYAGEFIEFLKKHYKTNALQ